MSSPAHRILAGSPIVRLRTAFATLGPSEQRVISTIITRPHDVVDWSTAELAGAAGTSPATVIRACQSAGFRGYQHVRLELVRSAPAPEARGGHILDRVFADTADALATAAGDIDRHSFDATVEVMTNAKRVLFVGTGFSSPPLHDAAMRFTTSGRPVEAPADVLAQQFTAHTLRSGDVCLAVSYSGANTHTLQACAAAVAEGAQLIAVTGFQRSPLTKIADLVLCTAPAPKAHRVDPFTVRIAQSVLLYALHSALPAAESDLQGSRTVVADALTD